MYKIEVYEEENGYSELDNYLSGLKEKAQSNKDVRVLFNKIVAYIDMLAEKENYYRGALCKAFGWRNMGIKAII